MSEDGDLPRYRDRGGRPLGMHEWGILFSMPGCKVVGLDVAGGWRCSTVWLGIDHSFGSGPPLIFETMVFPPWDHGDLYCERYATEGEAVEGHRRALEWMAREMSREAFEVRLLRPDELGE